ncbi:protein phosphatase 1 regulatory subunit 3B isoform X2 [Protopterus annectens]|uniref:protein phosphatase 1 regulatory subunit 3B isoform X2 n=1 Tax=Protopterus annectens TaxID=7888 RepID=UPI001CFA435D|nr:protein phosphatase 1 regulatory subunit 3B isoform X2 [Protopterus annectens]
MFLKALDILSPRPAMPLDVAMQLYLSPPLRREKKISFKRTPMCKKPLRPCIHLGNSTKVTDQVAVTTSVSPGKVKKRVSFADHKGLSLTTVKVFSEFDNSDDLMFDITDLIDNMVDLTTVERDTFVLNFAQPSSDYLEFRNRLHKDCVCLENCMLKDKAIVGTVKVKNLAFEKSVKLRITFDTWKTFSDYVCLYVKDIYAGTDKDTFSFEVQLPDKVSPHERIEFAVCYESGGSVFWDSNKGQNYRIIRSELHLSQGVAHSFNQVTESRVDNMNISFDQYGSPRCSHGIFPEWPSYLGYEKMGPYY